MSAMAAVRVSSGISIGARSKVGKLQKLVLREGLSLWRYDFPKMGIWYTLSSDPAGSVPGVLQPITA